MATVYEAYDPNFERTVAVKVLPRQFLHDPSFISRFEREAKTVAALEHPNVVAVYDVGEQDEQPYMVMRYMVGGSLASKLSEGSLSLPDCQRILARVAEALDFAHSKGVIHRDLKPGNILFDEKGEPCVSDFGIAKLMSSRTTELTKGTIVGTPAYMSPEQAKGEPLDGRSDVYALGVILFEMLAGKLPYTAETPTGVMMKHIIEPVPKLTDAKVPLPVGVQTVIEIALAKYPADRFKTCANLVSAFNASLQGKTVMMPSSASGKTGVENTSKKDPQTLNKSALKPSESQMMTGASPNQLRGGVNTSNYVGVATTAPSVQSKPKSNKGLIVGLAALGAACIIGGAGLVIGGLTGWLPNVFQGTSNQIFSSGTSISGTTPGTPVSIVITNTTGATNTLPVNTTTNPTSAPTLILPNVVPNLSTSVANATVTLTPIANNLGGGATSPTTAPAASSTTRPAPTVTSPPPPTRTSVPPTSTPTSPPPPTATFTPIPPSVTPHDPLACKPGFVWREAYAGDKVCVTPATRSQALADNAAAVSRRAPPNTAVPLPYGPDTCIGGYVWREARATDHICVLPAIRTQTANENALAASRREPGGGAFGPNTCKVGYVWREAYAGDVVCVPPSSRSQAAADNAAASSRRAPPNTPVPLPFGSDTCIAGFVWREARSTDHVCVTPATRSQTATDNALADSRRLGP